jgi:phosphate transport system protein
VTRVESALEELRQKALRMGSLAEAILARALRAVWERDTELAAEVAVDDVEVDRLDVLLEAEVTKILALQKPAAGDLRLLLAIRNLATDLERVGDLARNIARSAEALAVQPPFAFPPRLEELADLASRALSDALDSFSETDPQRARELLRDDDVLDETEDLLIQEVIREAAAHPERAAQEVELILIAKNLERVGDHATNIAEEVIFLAEARIVRHQGKLGGPAARS